jgi:hypothetical protein
VVISVDQPPLSDINAILSFDILYKAELALNNLRILTKSSLVVVLAVKLYLEL